LEVVQGEVQVALTDSAVTDIAVIDSTVTDSEVTDSAVTDSAVTDSVVTESAVTDSAATEQLDEQIRALQDTPVCCIKHRALCAVPLFHPGLCGDHM
jgi:hypothetical protein